MGRNAKLIFFTGKMAAGKSTLARELARREGAVLLVQDEWLEQLYPGEIREVADYRRCSTRLNGALEPIVCSLLASGVTVVLDFPANTRSQRAWFRGIIDRAGAPHELHFIDAPDALCKQQLASRSAHLAPGTPWTTAEEFDAVTAYFDAPGADESFTVIRHERS
jgi:predicted kinase